MSLVERFVVGVDIQKYSGRDTRRQQEMQRDLDRMLDDAADSAGVSRTLWNCQSGGDGEFAVLPADIDLLAVVRRFVAELDMRLAEHNEDHTPPRQIRLRLAMHSDVVTPGKLGWAGPALVVLARLLDSKPVRAALNDAPDAHLVQIISEPVYQKVVVSELGGLRPWQFRRVLVTLPEKDFRQPAYLYTPTTSVSPKSAPPAAAPAKRPVFPIPRPTARQPKPEPPRTPAVATKQPVPEPALKPLLHQMIGRIKAALAEHDVARADNLTTLTLVESAGRGRNGWLRPSDSDRVPLALLTELDAVWADSSGGAWGFRAQQQRLTGLEWTGRRDFRAICVRLGWRVEAEEIALPYAAFVAQIDRDEPCYPTLRNPEREPLAEWHDNWEATVISVHLRLSKREH